MTEVTKKAAVALDPKLEALFGHLNTVKSAGKKLLTINERAAAASADAAAASVQLVAVLQGETTEGEQDVGVLTKARQKALSQAEKIRNSAGEMVRDLFAAQAALNAQIAELTDGIVPAPSSEGEPKLTDEPQGENEQEEEEVDA